MTKMNISKIALGGAVQKFVEEVKANQVKMLEMASKGVAIAKFVIPMAAAEVIVLSLIMQLITKYSLGMSAINTVSKLMSEVAFVKLSADNYEILSQLALLGIFCLGVFKANISISDFVPKPATARRNEILLATISSRFFWLIAGIKILVDIMLNLRAEQMQWNYKNIAFYGVMVIILCIQQKRVISRGLKVFWDIFKEGLTTI
jgi:hypothetical protein